MAGVAYHLGAIKNLISWGEVEYAERIAWHREKLAIERQRQKAKKRGTKQQQLAAHTRRLKLIARLEAKLAKKERARAYCQLMEPSNPAYYRHELGNIELDLRILEAQLQEARLAR